VGDGVDRFCRAGWVVGRLYSDWPVDLPADWVRLVSQPQTAAEQEATQISIKRNRPFGDAAWQQEIAAKLGLSSCFHDPWRRIRKKDGAA